MEKYKRTLKGSVFLGLLSPVLLLAPSVSAAEYHHSEVVRILTPTMTVLSDGKKYTQSNDGHFRAEVKVGMASGFSGRVKSWKTWLVIRPQYQDYSREFPTGGYRKEYSSGNRPKEVDRTVPVLALANEIEQLMLGQCNTLARRLRDQGIRDDVIFGQDRPLTFFATSKLDYSFSGLSGTHFTGGQQEREFTVICKKTKDLSGSNTIAQVPSSVTEVSTNLIEGNNLQAGSCRINIAGVFKTDRANTEVKYKYVYRKQAGATKRYSEVKTTETSHAKIAMVSHAYDVPIVNGPERGQIRIETVGPNVKKSAWRNFEMNCSDGLSVATNHPIQRTVKFVPKTYARLGNQSCPITGNIAVILKSTGTPFEGTGRITVKDEKGQQFSSGPKEVSLTENTTRFFGMPFNPKWGNTGALVEAGSLGSSPQRKQTLRYALALAKAGQGTSASPPEKELEIECSMIAQSVTANSMALSAAQSSSNGGGQKPQAARSFKAVTLPDLVVKKAVQADGNKLKVLIANIGQSKAGKSLLKINSNPGKSKFKTIGALAAGKQNWVTINLPQGVKTVDLTIDAKKKIQEKNENNNRLKTKIK